MENENRKESELEAVIADFCSFFPYPEVKEELWYCVLTALGREGSLYDEATERVGILFLYEKLQRLLDAIYKRDVEEKIIAN